MPGVLDRNEAATAVEEESTQNTRWSWKEKEEGKDAVFQSPRDKAKTKKEKKTIRSCDVSIVGAIIS